MGGPYALPESLRDSLMTLAARLINGIYGAEARRDYDALKSLPEVAVQEAGPQTLDAETLRTISVLRQVFYHAYNAHGGGVFPVNGKYLNKDEIRALVDGGEEAPGTLPEQTFPAAPSPGEQALDSDRWRRLAIRMGELLAPTGPPGYYEFTAARFNEWLSELLNSRGFMVFHIPPPEDWPDWATHLAMGFCDFQLGLPISSTPEPFTNHRWKRLPQVITRPMPQEPPMPPTVDEMMDAWVLEKVPYDGTLSFSHTVALRARATRELAVRLANGEAMSDIYSKEVTGISRRSPS